MIQRSIETPLRAILILAISFSILSESAWARDKSDILYMQNGDRVTGEIKELKRSKVRLKTDHMGEIYVEWQGVVRVSSTYEFQIVASDGRRITGNFDGNDDKGDIIIKTASGDVTIPVPDIVAMAQIEQGFWEQVKGSVSAGYSFTKASDIAQTNLTFSATHRTEERSLKLSGSTVITDDQSVQSTQRSDLQFTVTRFRAKRWFNSYITGLESNDELGLDLRTRLGAGIGRYLLRSDASELALMGGLLGTNEQLQNDVPSENSLEGMAGIQYAHYIFHDPIIDLTTTLTAYPSITQSGRIRSQLDVSLRWELIKNLYWDLTFYDTYDSDPPSGSTSNNDYGIVTSLGYTF